MLQQIKVGWEVIRQTYRHGKRTVLLGLLLGFTLFVLNVLCFSGNLYWMLGEGLHAGEWLRLFIALLVSIASVGHFLWRAYGTFQTIAFHSVYAEFDKVILDLSERMLKEISKRGEGTGALNKMRWMNEQLKTLPIIVRMGVKLLLDVIPVLKLMDAAKKALLAKDIGTAAERFKTDLDEFVEEAYFEVTKMKWAYKNMLFVAIAYGLLAMLFFVG